MLLVADQNRTGVVDMPIERLAAKAGLSIDQTIEGLSILSSPDLESSSDEEEGRRLVPIRDDSTRGWRLVNWDKYKAIANEEQQREETRKRVAKHRLVKRSPTSESPLQQVTCNASGVTCNTSEAEADTEAKEESEKTIQSNFEDRWRRYPQRDGKAAAKRAFQKTVRTPKLVRRFDAALANYLAHLKANSWKRVKNGSTFFNNWQDWEEARNEKKGDAPNGDFADYVT